MIEPRESTPGRDEDHPAMVRARNQPQADPSHLHRLAKGDTVVYLRAMLEAGHLVSVGNPSVVAARRSANANEGQKWIG